MTLCKALLLKIRFTRPGHSAPSPPNSALYRNIPQTRPVLLIWQKNKNFKLQPALWKRFSRLKTLHMLKFMGINVLLALAITIPIIIWAGPFPSYSIAFIYIASLLVVSVAGGLIRRKRTDDTTKTKKPDNNNAAILLICACITMLTGCKDLHSDRSLTTCRDFLSAGMSPRCDVGAYGYLLFARPADNDKKSIDKINYVAELFRTGFETQNSIHANGVKPANLMIMYWMVKDTLGYRGDLPAKEMTGSYDFARAKVILSKLNKPSAAGPVLVAWSKPCSGDAASSEALIFDMSGFDNEDLSRAFGIWIERVSKDPLHWENGFKLEQFRSEFRNFVNNNGEILYKLILAKDKPAV